jgi:hypothetical protein
MTETTFTCGNREVEEGMHMTIRAITVAHGYILARRGGERVPRYM